MWTIKRPLKNLESKTWPEINLENIYDEDVRTESITYLAHYKFNGKEIS